MVDWIIRTITEQGYLAILLLMCAENVFPPLPSELIMPFAGFAAARGDLSLAGVMISGTLGSLLGALPWYVAGRRVGGERLRRFADRHGRWLTVSREELDTADRWFHRHGPLVLVVGRMVPAVRTLIAAPAGVMRLSWLPFLGWSLLGSLLWTGVLTGAGFVLESRYEQISRWIDPVAKGVVALLVLGYVVRVLRYGRRRSPDADRG
ncbi:DedA family protein [Aquabacterium sp. A7-Y]|uniref:DedA family protein n=1 Tax=Aquabacterium sp. A7-Y TaxID=1349605 RepID=UPI00223DF1ED|nr:DedA family protein [Aquabacterium sp. A7-Y]MCW7540017.1 DedA family protein [Aquabacterium sp. A7-Y]